MSLKESLPGFFIEKDPAELTNVVVALDTNLLFSLLTVNQKTFDELYKVLEQLNSKNQLFIPNHVAKEYILDAEDTCRRDGKIYSNANQKIDTFLSNYSQIESDYKDRVSDFKVIKDRIEAFNKELKDVFKEQLNKPDYTKRKEDVEKLFTNIGKPYSRKKLYKLQKEIEFRFKAFIPPGFKDNTKTNGNKYGDCIIWFQLMDYAKKENKDIIYVTIDVKEDWQINNQFRKELYNEFFLETEKKLFIYNPDELIAIYNKFTEPKETASKETVTESSRKLTDLLIDSLPKTTWGSYELPLVTTALDSKKWGLVDSCVQLDDVGLLNYNNDYLYGNLLSQNYNLYNTAELLGKKTQLSILQDAVNSRLNTLSLMNNMIDQKSKQLESKNISMASSQKEKAATDSAKKEETDKKEKK